MSRKREYVEPDDVHDYVFDLADLNDSELRQCLGALLDHLQLDVWRTNRNKHAEMRIEVRERQ